MAAKRKGVGRTAGGGGAALARLEGTMHERGEGAADRRRAALAVLERATLRTAAEVARLHEALCFLRAYPDDARVLAQVERMLAGFDRRDDLARHRAALSGSGIAGTEIPYRFFYPTAVWLARRWGRQLSLDWKELGEKGSAAIERLLSRFALYAESPGLDGCALDVREWIEAMKGPRETDAEFVVRRFDAMRMEPAAREIVYEEVDPPLVLAPGPDTPSRTRAKLSTARFVPRGGPLRRGRPDLHEELGRPPRSVRPAMPSEAREVLDLARGMMVTMNRDLDVFSYGSEEDVRLAECEEGLAFAFIGFAPERRLLLETLYGFVTLQNGVPIGYGTVACLFGSAEVAYNVSESFRGGEAALVFGRLLACTRHLCGVDTFYLDPYQIGDDNEEAVRSGAWWFYQKLGFRARDPKVLRLMERELRAARSSPGHRSSPATIRKLASAGVFFHAGPKRDDILGVLPLERVGLRVTRYLAERFGADRERAAQVCAQEASRLLGVAPGPGASAGERLWWERWAPLVCALPGIARWGAADRARLVEVIRAKGGTRESEYVARFDAHAGLRAAVLAVSGST